MANSTILGIPLIAEGTAGRITANVWFSLIEILLRKSVQDRAATSPAGVNGNAYILTGTGGSWSTFAVNDIAIYHNGWYAFTPAEGWTFWVDDEDTPYRFDGTNWIEGITTTKMIVGAGTAALPSYSFNGDPNTGVYASAADQVAVSTGGVQRAVFASTLLTVKTPLFVDIASFGGTGAGFRVSDSLIANYVKLDTDGTSGMIFAIAGTNTLVLDAAALRPITALGSLFDLGTTALHFRDAFVDRVQLANGTVGAPALTLDADDNSGLYAIGADNLGIAVGGVKIIDIGTTIALGKTTWTGANVVVRDSGVASRGMIDTDGTVLYLATGGVARLYLDSTILRSNTDDTIRLGASTTRWSEVFAVEFKASDGTVSLPSVTFHDDENSGDYRVGADRIGRATGGVQSTEWCSDQTFTCKDALARKLTRNTIADTGTVTSAQIRDGILYQDASAGSVTMTSPTGTLLDTEFPDLQTGESIDVYHASNHATNTSTISGGTGVTLIGSGAVTNTGGQYKLVKTGAAAYDLVRVG